MGYYSNVVIAINKKLLAEHLIMPIIPRALSEHDYTDTETARYWIIENWKWYENYPEIQEIEEFFQQLDSRMNDHPSSDDPLYGAIRIGENIDDYQEWGEPHEFEVYVHRRIDCPVNI